MCVVLITYYTSYINFYIRNISYKYKWQFLSSVVLLFSTDAANSPFTSVCSQNE